MIPYWTPEVLSSLKVQGILDILTAVAVLGTGSKVQGHALRSDSDKSAISQLLQAAAPLVMNHVDTTLKELELKYRQQRADQKGTEAGPKDIQANHPDLALKPEWPVWQRASKAFFVSGLVKPKIGQEVLSKIKLLEAYKVKGLIHSTAAGDESATS
jgi:hypothetical protein